MSSPALSGSIKLLRDRIPQGYTDMLREPGGALAHPFIVPGSAQYLDQLWDWDSWLTNVALRQIVLETGASESLRPYERGCILNFLSTIGWHGWMPVMLPRSGAPRAGRPVCFQHAQTLHRTARRVSCETGRRRCGMAA